MNEILEQLRRSIEMRQQILDYAHDLDAKMNCLDDTLTEYVRQGFPSDLAAAYQKSCYNPDKQTINDLCATMTKGHVAYWDGIIALLREAAGE